MTNKRRWPLTLLTGVLLVIALAIVFIPSEWYPEGWLSPPVEPASDETEPHETQTQAASEPAVQAVTIEDNKELHLRENGLIYQVAQDPDVVCMYLTVMRGNTAENTNHSWEEINTYSVFNYQSMGVPRYQVAAILQVGNENGPLSGMLGYEQTIPNATVQIRGQSSSKNAQKNYKIELLQGMGEWNGQRTIALNKHQSDGMRFRNKLAYELLEEIPQLMGLRTQFVHLYVKDLTGETPTEFVDYGLYTQVEQLNKTALKAHGLSQFGDLYKINVFEFYRYEDIVKPTYDPTFNREAMEELIENKSESDNTKLIDMLDAVNNISIPVDNLLDKYFDRENILYWMAYQILIGNTDTQNRNMYIYSPPNSQKWFIYPWDHDGGFFRYEYRLKNRNNASEWETGISNYWGNVLFQRLLKQDDFRADLDRVIRELRDGVLSEANVAAKAERLRAIAEPFVFSPPDMYNEGLKPEQYDEVAKHLPEEIETSYQLYLESLEKPLPFYIGKPYQEGDKLVFEWDPAYDFDDETIHYELKLAHNPDFTELLAHETDMLLPTLSVPMLEPGQYFVQLIATNTSGYSQPAFDYYRGNHGRTYGTKCFWIYEDGQIEELVN